MGDTLDYIEGECKWWVKEIESMLSKGMSMKMAVDEVGEPPLEDCWNWF